MSESFSEAQPIELNIFEDGKEKEIMKEKGEIVIYQTQDGITKLDARLDGDTVWITQEQMAQLFERDRTAIGRHISKLIVFE